MQMDSPLLIQKANSWNHRSRIGSSSADGGEVEKGGVGEILLNRSSARNIYTYMGSDSNLTVSSNAFTIDNTLITPTSLGLASWRYFRAE